MRSVCLPVPFAAFLASSLTRRLVILILRKGRTTPIRKDRHEESYACHNHAPVVYQPGHGRKLDSFLNNSPHPGQSRHARVFRQTQRTVRGPLATGSGCYHDGLRTCRCLQCFQLGYMTRTPYEKVVQVYQGDRGKGWGVIAKSLGIKPGSPEFHALKRGDFVFNGEPDGGTEQGESERRERDTTSSLLLRVSSQLFAPGSDFIYSSPLRKTADMVVPARTARMQTSPANAG